VNAPLAGPLPLSRVWSGAKVLAEDLTGEDLADVLDLHSGAMAWWVLDRSSPYGQEEVRRLAKVLDLDDVAVADLTAADERAKFEQIGQARLVVTNAVGLQAETGSFTVHPVSLLITNRAVICLADAGPAFDPARLLTVHADRLAQDGVEAAAQVLVSAIVAGYGEVLDWLTNASDGLTSTLFEERPLSKAEQLLAFRLRKQLAGLRRLTDPMRTITADLRLSCEVTEAPVTRQWMLIEENHARTASAADRLREELGTVFETSLALADMQLNVIVKKLSGWAAIIAVPTLVTSFVGMNVGFPLAGTAAGFWVYFVLMLAVSVVLFVVFRRQNWI
jgi:magnesium transporter